MIDTGIGQMPSTGHRSRRHGHQHRLRRCAAGSQPDRPVCLECLDRRPFAIFPLSDNTCLFQAINAPLQQRTPALDLDFTRANAFPADYETDVELEWSNPSKSSLLLTLLTLLSPCP